MSDRSAAPATAGWCWPAEWQAHDATWLSWPHKRESWPGHFERVPDAFVAIVRALSGHELVRINVADAALAEVARRALHAGGVDVDRVVRFVHAATNDAWARDHGGIFAVRERAGMRERAILDFGFNAWGGKYPPFDLDAAVPRHMAVSLDLPRFEADFVLGGSIDGDGKHDLTESACSTRIDPGRHVRWLGDGILGDDTDGYIDDITRFVAPGVVVTVLEDDPADANHEPLRANLARLRGMRNAAGRPLSIATLPMPPPVVVDGQRCPASYANFYLANGVCLVPVFRAPQDARALAVMRELLPGRDVVGIDCRDLVYGLGAIHCVTQQEPAA